MILHLLVSLVRFRDVNGPGGPGAGAGRAGPGPTKYKSRPAGLTGQNGPKIRLKNFRGPKRAGPGRKNKTRAGPKNLGVLPSLVCTN